MSNTEGSSTPLAVIKRGKLVVANQIRTDLNRSSGSSISSSSGLASGTQQLEEILNYFLNVERPIDFEAIDWCRCLIAGGLPYEDYATNGNYLNCNSIVSNYTPHSTVVLSLVLNSVTLTVSSFTFINSILLVLCNGKGILDIQQVYY